jgi:hypothetical protein
MSDTCSSECLFNASFYGTGEIQSGCKIIADGTSAANAVITVDFGQGACTSGWTVALVGGRIFIDAHEVIQFGPAYQDIVLIMSDCDDKVTIAQTYTDTASVEVIGNAGNDRVILGDMTDPLDTLIFANVIVDGGRGDSDLLRIYDDGSSTYKPIGVRPTVLYGIHGIENKTISYFAIENIHLSLGTAAALVNIYSTARFASFTLITQGKQVLHLRINECIIYPL